MVISFASFQGRRRATWSDHGSEPDPGGPRRDRAEENPGVEHSRTRYGVELEVIPEEEAVPSGPLGGDGEVDQLVRISGVGHADCAAHAVMSMPISPTLALAADPVPGV